VRTRLTSISCIVENLLPARLARNLRGIPNLDVL